MLIIIFKILFPIIPAPSEIGVRVPSKFPGFKTPIVTEITKTYKVITTRRESCSM